MALKKMLLEGETNDAGAEKRILPGLSVERWDRLHFHISNGSRAVNNLQVRVLFGTPAGSKVLLADSTVWFEDSKNERDFVHSTPPNYGGTGFILSVPVVAPVLYDVILRNLGEEPLTSMFVTVNTTCAMASLPSSASRCMITTSAPVFALAASAVAPKSSMISRNCGVWMRCTSCMPKAAW